MSPYTSVTGQMLQPKKQIRTTSSTASGIRSDHKIPAIEHLKKLGDLSTIVNNHGHLPVYVKTTLELVPHKALDAYFESGKRGHKLLSAICFNAELDEVRYAIETLRLNRLPQVSTSSSDCHLCAVISALGANEPQPAVLQYLTKHGYKVSRKAFVMWSMTRGDKIFLWRLLEPLIKFGRNQLPPMSELLHYMTIDHIKVLQKFVRFDIGDIHFAACEGDISAVVEMSVSCPAVTWKRRHRLADIFELCEVSCYFRSRELFGQLRYFRKSLEFRPGARTDSKWTSYGKWRLFESSEDIDRLEKQMTAGDFVETTWQILLAGSRLKYSSDIICSNFFQSLHVNDLHELARMKYFVLDTAAYLKPRLCGRYGELKENFLSGFWQYCRDLIVEVAQPSVSILPGFYNCCGEYLPLQRPGQDLISEFADAVARMDIDRLFSDFIEIQQWRDECLFILALIVVNKPSRPAVWTVMKLLVGGASLLILPGKHVSTLSLLLRDPPRLPEYLRKELISRMCCQLDTSLWQLMGLDVDTSCFVVVRLRCLAAIVCRRALQDNLIDLSQQDVPASVVEVALGHPDKNHD